MPPSSDPGVQAPPYRSLGDTQPLPQDPGVRASAYSPLGPGSPSFQTSCSRDPRSLGPRPSPGSGGERVKCGRADSETAQTRRADVTALTQGNLPPPSSSPPGTPGVRFRDTMRGQAWRSWNPRTWGIPAQTEDLGRVATREIPGWGQGQGQRESLWPSLGPCLSRPWPISNAPKDSVQPLSRVWRLSRQPLLLGPRQGSGLPSTFIPRT